MNLTIEPTQLPAPQLPAPPPPPRRRWGLIASGAVLGLATIAVVAASFAIDEDDVTADATVDTVADLDVSDAGSIDASTGDASVDEMIVDVTWESMGEAKICPALRDVKEAMPGLSDGEIFDMGVELADLGEDMTPAQLDRMRELVLRDC